MRECLNPAQDIDYLFSYRTQRQVGISNPCVAFHGPLHFEREHAVGFAVTQARESTVLAKASAGAPPRLFTTDEVVVPGQERGSIFVATHVDISQEKRGRLRGLPFLRGARVVPNK